MGSIGFVYGNTVLNTHPSAPLSRITQGPEAPASLKVH